MATRPNWPQLAQGQNSTNVKALQYLLVYHGANISTDGIFGSGTKAAVVNFQSNNGLSADGIAGAATLSALITTVSVRTQNKAAWAAQTLLAKFESLTVDGDYYTGSLVAARNFQEKMGIYEPEAYSEPGYGAVDAITWQYLFGYDAYPSAGGTPEITGNVYASTAQINSTLSTAQMNANASYVYNYLLQEGFTKQAACAVIGNMQHESDIDPGVWQSSNNVSLGYGLLQWDDATKFLNDAVEQGHLSNANPSTVNNLALSNPKALMDAELDYFVRSCAPGQGEFYAPKYAAMQHTEYRMSFSTFKASTINVGELAIVFHDHYERSDDGTTNLNKRSSYATNWYNYF